MSGTRRSGSFMDETDEPEVQSPLKQQQDMEAEMATGGGGGVSRKLNL